MILFLSFVCDVQPRVFGPLPVQAQNLPEVLPAAAPVDDVLMEAVDSFLEQENRSSNTPVKASNTHVRIPLSTQHEATDAMVLKPHVSSFSAILDQCFSQSMCASYATTVQAHPLSNITPASLRSGKSRPPPTAPKPNRRRAKSCPPARDLVDSEAPLASPDSTSHEPLPSLSHFIAPLTSPSDLDAPRLNAAEEETKEPPPPPVICVAGVNLNTPHSGETVDAMCLRLRQNFKALVSGTVIGQVWEQETDAIDQLKAFMLNDKVNGMRMICTVCLFVCLFVFSGFFFF